jgi:hypothetical protein
MWIDPLVEEIRQRRRDLMAEFDYDPRKFLDFLKGERRKYSDRLTRPTKNIRSTEKSQPETTDME